MAISMYTSLLLGGLFATTLATPLVARQEWAPAEGTTATCDATADKYVSLVVGPEQGDVIFDHACAGIMPACAYPEQISEDTVCTQSTDYKLNGPRNTTLGALVESKENHVKLPGWAVNFAITPADSAGVSLTKADCIGYFKELLLKSYPEGCEMPGYGPSAGNLTVGGTSPLKDAVFGMTFVKK